MNPALEGFVLWLADFYLAATLLLLAACAALTLLKQPARRMAVAWGTFIALLLAAFLCGVASRPRVDLRSLIARPAPLAVEVMPNDAVPSSPTVHTTLENSIETTPPVAVSETVVELPVEVAAQPVRVIEAVPERKFDFQKALAGGLWIFLIGSALITVRLVVGVWQAVRLVRGSGAAPRELVEELRSIVGAGVQLPRLRLHGQLVTPVATGTFWPTIALPRRFYEMATREELRAALAHEWAHIRNGDLWLLALDRCLLPVLWAHPIFGVVRRRARQDQELLADAAAATLADPAEYAAQLVAWARDLAGIRRVAVSHAVGIWERPTGLALRISNLLNNSDRMAVRCSGRVRGMAVVGLALLSLLAVSISVRPPIAASEPPAPNEAAIGRKSEFPTANGFHVGAQQIGGTCLDPEQNPLSRVEVSLYVIDYDDGQKLLQQTATDNAGQFVFRNVPLIKGGRYARSHYLLIAQQKGRASAIKQARLGEWQDLSMPKAAPFKGAIHDAQGQPIRGALVYLGSAVGFDYPVVPVDGLRAARSNEKGAFEIQDLAPYQYIRRNFTSKRRRGMVAFTPGPPWMRIEHPDYAGRIVPFTAIPGAIDVVLAKGSVVKGRLIDEKSGKPAAHVKVFIQEIRGQDFKNFMVLDRGAETDASGYYRFHSVPKGKFNICLSSRLPDRTAVAINSFEVPEGQAVEAPAMRLIRGGVVKGLVIDDVTGKPVVHDDDEFLDVQVWGPSRPNTGDGIDIAEIAMDGTFEIRLPPGKNFLGLRTDNTGEIFMPADGGSSGGYYSVPDGGELELEFHVRRVKPPKKVEGKATQIEPSLKVRVVNNAGRSVGGATVIAGWPGAKNAPYKKQQFTSDTSGSVELPASTGPRRLLAFASDGELAGQTLVKPDEAEATVTIGKAARLHGRLLNMELSPIRRRRLLCSITDAKGDETVVHLTGQTDDAGEFVFAGVPAGARARLYWLNPLDKMYAEGVSFLCHGPGKVELGDILDREFIVSWTKDRMDDKWLPPVSRLARMSWDEMNAANADFSEAYSLNEGQNVRRFYHHLGDVRRRWVQRHYSGNAGIGEWGPAMTLVRYQDKTLGWEATFSGEPEPSRSLKSVIKSVCGLGDAEIEGPNKLLQTSVTGDFLFRLGSPTQKRVAELEKILWDELQLRVQLNLEEEPRKVFVAEGTFQLKPLPKHPGAVVLYSEAGPDGPDINGWGGGSGSFREFLEATANHIQRRIVNGVQSPPKTQVEWFFTGSQGADAVLKHVTEQTGVTFREETRTMRVLHVE